MAFTNVTTRTVISSSVYNANLTEAQNQLDEKNNSAMIQNLTLVSSVSGNALTIAVKDRNGSNPSSASPVKVAVQSSSLNGTWNIRTITSALSLTISSGSTLGQTSNKPWVQWIYLIDNAGTLELAIMGSLAHENQLASTLAEGGAGGADSISTMYSTTARTNVPFRLIGKLVNTQTMAGTWTSAGTNLYIGTYGQLTSGYSTLGLYPTTQTFTSGSGTYYTPAGCTRIIVRMVGGGGGGGGGGQGGAVANGGNGTSTTFGSALLTAGAGGGGTHAANSSYSAGGSNTINSPAIAVLNLPGGEGAGGINASWTGYSSGMYGASSVLGGAGAPAANAVGNTPKANSGSGGAGGGTNAAGSGGGGGGGSGGFIEAIIYNPQSSYSYSIGTGGTAGPAGTNGYNGSVGASGIIIVEEYYA